MKVSRLKLHTPGDTASTAVMENLKFMKIVNYIKSIPAVVSGISTFSSSCMLRMCTNQEVMIQ